MMKVGSVKIIHTGWVAFMKMHIGSSQNGAGLVDSKMAHIGSSQNGRGWVRFKMMEGGRGSR